MDFISKFKEYIKKNSDFEIVNINGSYADTKSKKRYDKFSDLDLFIITKDKIKYLEHPEWLNFYGKEFIYFNDPISLGIGTELRVAFDDGLLADIAIVDNEEYSLLRQNDIFKEKIEGRGTLCLKNIYGTSQKTKNVQKSNNKITAYELNRKVDEFWIDISNIYKYLSRDDVFSAKYAFDRRIMKLLIYVLEKYTIMINPNIDVMFNGRNMKKWLDSVNMQKISEINSSMKQDDMLKCIDLAIDLFNDITCKIFEHYKFEADNRIKIINSIKEKRN